MEGRNLGTVASAGSCYMPAGRRRAVEGTAAVVVGRRFVPGEEAPRTELAVRRTAREPVLHKARALVVGHRADRMEKEEVVRHTVAEEPAAGGNSPLAVLAEEDMENAPEEDIDLEEVVGNSPGCLPAALLAVSPLYMIFMPSIQRIKVLLTAIGRIVWIRHYGDLSRYLVRDTAELLPNRGRGVDTHEQRSGVKRT